MEREKRGTTNMRKEEGRMRTEKKDDTRGGGTCLYH